MNDIEQLVKANRRDDLAVWLPDNDYDDNLQSYYYCCSKCSARSRFMFHKCPWCSRTMTNGEIRIEE